MNLRVFTVLALAAAVILKSGQQPPKPFTPGLTIPRPRPPPPQSPQRGTFRNESLFGEEVVAKHFVKDDTVEAPVLDTVSLPRYGGPMNIAYHNGKLYKTIENMRHGPVAEYNGQLDQKLQNLQSLNYTMLLLSTAIDATGNMCPRLLVQGVDDRRVQSNQLEETAGQQDCPSTVIHTPYSIRHGASAPEGGGGSVGQSGAPQKSYPVTSASPAANHLHSHLPTQAPGGASSAPSSPDSSAVIRNTQSAATSASEPVVETGGSVVVSRTPLSVLTLQGGGGQGPPACLPQQLWEKSYPDTSAISAAQQRHSHLPTQATGGASSAPPPPDSSAVIRNTQPAATSANEPVVEAGGSVAVGAPHSAVTLPGGGVQEPPARLPQQLWKNSYPVATATPAVQQDNSHLPTQAPGGASSAPPRPDSSVNIKNTQPVATFPGKVPVEASLQQGELWKRYGQLLATVILLRDERLQLLILCIVACFLTTFPGYADQNVDPQPAVGTLLIQNANAENLTVVAGLEGDAVLAYNGTPGKTIKGQE